MNNFLFDVQDLYPLQKEKKIKRHRKGLGTDYVVTLGTFCYRDQSFIKIGGGWLFFSRKERY